MSLRPVPRPVSRGNGQKPSLPFIGVAASTKRTPSDLPGIEHLSLKGESPVHKHGSDVGMFAFGQSETKQLSDADKAKLTSPETRQEAKGIMQAMAAVLGSDTDWQQMENGILVTWVGQSLGKHTVEEVIARRRQFNKAFLVVPGLGKVLNTRVVDLDAPLLDTLNATRAPMLAHGMMPPSSNYSLDAYPEPIQDAIRHNRVSNRSLVVCHNALRKLTVGSGANDNPFAMNISCDLVFTFGKSHLTVIPERIDYMGFLRKMFDDVWDKESRTFTHYLPQENRDGFGIHMLVMFKMFHEHILTMTDPADPTVPLTKRGQRLKAFVMSPISVENMGGAPALAIRAALRDKANKNASNTEIAYAYFWACERTFQRGPLFEENKSAVDRSHTVQDGQYNDYINADGSIVDGILDEWDKEKELIASNGQHYRYKAFPFSQNPKTAAFAAYIDFFFKLSMCPCDGDNWYGASALNFYMLMACTDRINWSVSSETMNVSSINIASVSPQKDVSESRQKRLLELKRIREERTGGGNGDRRGKLSETSNQQNEAREKAIRVIEKLQEEKPMPLVPSSSSSDSDPDPDPAPAPADPPPAAAPAAAPSASSDDDVEEEELQNPITDAEVLGEEEPTSGDGAVPMDVSNPTTPLVVYSANGHIQPLGEDEINSRLDPNVARQMKELSPTQIFDPNEATLNDTDSSIVGKLLANFGFMVGGNVRPVTVPPETRARSVEIAAAALQLQNDVITGVEQPAQEPIHVNIAEESPEYWQRIALVHDFLKSHAMESMIKQIDRNAELMQKLKDVSEEQHRKDNALAQATSELAKARERVAQAEQEVQKEKGSTEAVQNRLNKASDIAEKIYAAQQKAKKESQNHLDAYNKAQEEVTAHAANVGRLQEQINQANHDREVAERNLAAVNRENKSVIDENERTAKRLRAEDQILGNKVATSINEMNLKKSQATTTIEKGTEELRRQREKNLADSDKEKESLRSTKVKNMQAERAAEQQQKADIREKKAADRRRKAKEDQATSAAEAKEERTAQTFERTEEFERSKAGIKLRQLEREAEDAERKSEAAAKAAEAAAKAAEEAEAQRIKKLEAEKAAIERASKAEEYATRGKGMTERAKAKAVTKEATAKAQKSRDEGKAVKLVAEAKAETQFATAEATRAKTVREDAEANSKRLAREAKEKQELKLAEQAFIMEQRRKNAADKRDFQLKQQAQDNKLTFKLAAALNEAEKNRNQSRNALEIARMAEETRRIVGKDKNEQMRIVKELQLRLQDKGGMFCAKTNSSANLSNASSKGGDAGHTRFNGYLGNFAGIASADVLEWMMAFALAMGKDGAASKGASILGANVYITSSCLLASLLMYNGKFKSQPYARFLVTPAMAMLFQHLYTRGFVLPRMVRNGVRAIMFGFKYGVGASMKWAVSSFLKSSWWEVALTTVQLGSVWYFGVGELMMTGAILLGSNAAIGSAATSAAGAFASAALFASTQGMGYLSLFDDFNLHWTETILKLGETARSFEVFARSTLTSMLGDPTTAGLAITAVTILIIGGVGRAVPASSDRHYIISLFQLLVKGRKRYREELEEEDRERAKKRALSAAPINDQLSRIIEQQRSANDARTAAILAEMDEDEMEAESMPAETETDTSGGQPPRQDDTGTSAEEEAPMRVSVLPGLGDHFVTKTLTVDMRSCLRDGVCVTSVLVAQHLAMHQ